MEFSGVQMPTVEGLVDFSRSCSRMSDPSCGVSVPIHITFAMEDTMFEETFSHIPNYGALWKTLHRGLHLDSSPAITSFKIYMDDVLLTNRNTLDLLSEAIASASETSGPVSVLLTVSRHTTPERRASKDSADLPVDYRKQRWGCQWVCPHALYLLALLLLTMTLNGRMQVQEDKIRHEMAALEGFTNTLKAKIQHDMVAIDGWTSTSMAAGGSLAEASVGADPVSRANETDVLALIARLGSEEGAHHALDPAQAGIEKAALHAPDAAHQRRELQHAKNFQEYTSRLNLFTKALNENINGLLAEATSEHSELAECEAARAKDRSKYEAALETITKLRSKLSSCNRRLDQLLKAVRREKALW